METFAGDPRQDGIETQSRRRDLGRSLHSAHVTSLCQVTSYCHVTSHCHIPYICRLSEMRKELNECREEITKVRSENSHYMQSEVRMGLLYI